MSAEESQQEEIEVLNSIYEGDDNYKAISDTVYQYKVGEDGHYQSFVVEVSWGNEYPEQLPTINMDTFYNKNILPEIKQAIIEKMNEQAEMLQGCAMTYSLFEFAKENQKELMIDQPEQAGEAVPAAEEMKDESLTQEKKVKERKEQLTKAQKRRIVNRIDLKTGERPRGWDWVDLIKHLGQTGSKDS